MFDEDIRDADWRTELSAEQLDALERRQRQCEAQQQSAAERPKVRMVGAERARLGLRGSRGLE